MKSPMLALLLSFAASSAAFAADGSITVEQAWARPTAPGAVNGAAYLAIKNSGKTDDVLLGVESNAATKAELHESSMDGGVMKMRRLGAVPVPAGGSVEFKPGGKHIMLMGLKAPLTTGQSFSLILQFKNAGTETVKVDVAASTPMGAMDGMGNMPGMDMHH